MREAFGFAYHMDDSAVALLVVSSVYFVEDHSAFQVHISHHKLRSGRV